MEKIFIVSNNIDRCFGVSDELMKNNDSLNVANIFISTEDNTPNGHYYYQDNEKIGLDYLNNSLLFVNNINDDFANYGITLDEMYNSDIICLKYCDFLNISDYILDEISPTIIWVDDSLDNVNSCECIDASTFEDIMNRMGFPLLYFCSDESIESISLILNEYLNADETRKNEIIIENS